MPHLKCPTGIRRQKGSQPAEAEGGYLDATHATRLTAWRRRRGGLTLIVRLVAHRRGNENGETGGPVARTAPLGAARSTSGPSVGTPGPSTADA